MWFCRTVFRRNSLFMHFQEYPVADTVLYCTSVSKYNGHVLIADFIITIKFYHKHKFCLSIIIQFLVMDTIQLKLFIGFFSLCRLFEETLLLKQHITTIFCVQTKVNFFNNFISCIQKFHDRWCTWNLLESHCIRTDRNVKENLNAVENEVS